ncbi:MAG: hypothetical protein LAT65_13630 [Saccharospirillum sp.]|nr:hypothetical protein [Saccharospirillum sp.]
MTNPNLIEEALADKEIEHDITHILSKMSSDLAHLVVVEAKLFGHTVLAMIWLTIIIALMLVGGWLFAGAALAMFMASLQFFNLTGALLVVALVHLLFAALGYWRLKHITRDLKFNESRTSASNLLTHARSLVDTAEQSPKEN